MEIIFDDFRFGEVATLSLENVENDLDSNTPLSLDIWGFDGALVVIDIKAAEHKPVLIDSVKLITHNYTNVVFAQKKYKITIKNLECHVQGINLISKGVDVGECYIATSNSKISLNGFTVDTVNIKYCEDEDSEVVRKLLKGVSIIPSCGEYVLDPKYSHEQKAFSSLSEMKKNLPSAEWISVIVSWFASSLNVAECEIKPGLDANYKHPTHWQVGQYNVEGKEGSAPHKILQMDGNSIYGGSTNDASVVKYLEFAKSEGFKIIFYPLLMVNQPDKPWRGLIGKDGNSKAEDIESFYENQYKPFILHYAKLVGKVDAFIIGSELVGLTSLKSADNQFPFVNKLIELAHLVKTILGSEVKVTYAANWSGEYHTVDGCLRPLDNLWASRDIDFVGINAYFPLTCSSKSHFSLEEIKKGWESGEGYDFYINNGQKIPFNANEPWNMWKNLSYWWHSEHWEWDQQKQQSIKTAWKPETKPIWFTEFGFPSIKGCTNEPSMYNTQLGVQPDFAIQRKAVRATLEYWQNSEFVKNLICWAWDARGLGWENDPYFTDGKFWQSGHWLDGKICQPEFSIELSGSINVKKKLSVDAKMVLVGANISVGNKSLPTEIIYLNEGQTLTVRATNHRIAK